jgi:S-formylglutathione hydrolase
MTFSVFAPPRASPAQPPAPVLFYLSGLTCTDENVAQKGGASRACAAHGVALVCPDTSPRGNGVAGEDDSWDLGTGAGFYVDATAEPWQRGGYRMESYVQVELRALVAEHPEFAGLDGSRASITGHSMGVRVFVLRIRSKRDDIVIVSQEFRF